jgi:hypothetical protein
MARKSVIGLWIVLACLLTLNACGLKAPPEPRSKLLPATVTDLKAVTKADGIELSFSVPQKEEPGKKIHEVLLYHGYLPLGGNPDCPPCPPRLNRYRTLSLLGEDNKLMQGGQFKYLDENAPMNKEAYYQVILVDAMGRESLISNLVHAPRVTPPQAPTGLVAAPGEKVVELTWDSAELVSKTGTEDGLLGWVLFRKDQAGEKQLVSRPLKEAALNDKTVSNGQAYSYRVAAVHRVSKVSVTGEPSEWVTAVPQDATPPTAPVDLAAGSGPQGIHLRFTPSPEQDTAGYLILRANKEAGPWAQIGKMSVENAITDENVKSGKTYFYKVQAVDDSGNKSGMSEVISITYDF